MKVATIAPAPDFAALAELNFCHSADWQLIELEANKRAYARVYEQYKKLMEMEEAGITVTVILTSPAGTITVENDRQFEPMEYLQVLSNDLNARAAHILDLSAKQQQGLLLGDTEAERDKNALRLQAHALCLPADYTPATPTVTTAPATAQAA